MQRLLSALVVFLVATAGTGANAWAQSTTVQATPPPAGTAQLTVDCGAGMGDRNTCAADTSSGVVLLRQTGDGNCALGKTWGFDAKGVWVADGCRGTFALSDSRLKVDCAAAAGAREVCKANDSCRGGARHGVRRPACRVEPGATTKMASGSRTAARARSSWHARVARVRLRRRSAALRRRHVGRCRTCHADRTAPAARRFLGLRRQRHLGR